MADVDRTAAVRDYYGAKTSDILQKYGPGPRVHFHVGLFDVPSAIDSASAPRTVIESPDGIRRQLTRSQEATLDHAAAVWRVAHGLDLLDVGCGLGGGAIYWAERHHARVTALTNIAEHLTIVERFASEAGVEHLVTPMLADVHTWHATSRYDAAVALESSGYMRRPALFGMAARALRPGGWFGIEEHFVRDRSWAAILDRYYHTQLGTVAEYIASAEHAGFILEVNDDVTERVIEFWARSQAWTMRIMESSTSDLAIARARLVESARMHAQFVDVWRNRAVETRLLLFRLGSSR